MTKKQILAKHLQKLTNSYLGDSLAENILDAMDEYAEQYHQSQSEVSDEAIDEWLEKEDYSFVGIFIKKSEMIEHFIKEEDAIELIKKGIKEFKPQSITNSVSDEWISVEDRLPENWKIVIVYYHIADERYSMTSGHYDGVSWKIDRIDENKVTHWQPLPTPPINKE